jgi:hypothetical protein
MENLHKIIGTAIIALVVVVSYDVVKSFIDKGNANVSTS